MQRENRAKRELRRVDEYRPRVPLRADVRAGISDREHGKNNYMEVEKYYIEVGVHCG